MWTQITRKQARVQGRLWTQITRKISQEVDTQESCAVVRARLGIRGKTMLSYWVRENSTKQGGEFCAATKMKIRGRGSLVADSL